MLALSFLLLIGVSLVAEGLEFHIPKGYIYFSMAFALLVDIFQMKMTKRKSAPVKTREHYLPPEAEPKGKTSQPHDQNYKKEKVKNDRARNSSSKSKSR